MSVVASKVTRFGFGPFLGAVLGLGMLLGGCVETGSDVDDDVDSEQVGELKDELLAGDSELDEVDGESELEDVDGDGDIDVNDIELLLDRKAATHSEPGSENSLGAPGQGNDPSPQPWQPHDDDSATDPDTSYSF